VNGGPGWCERLLLLPFESCRDDVARAAVGIPPGGAVGIPAGAPGCTPAVPCPPFLFGLGGADAPAGAAPSPPGIAAPSPPGIPHRCGRCWPPCRGWRRTLSYFWPAVVRALGTAPVYAPVLETLLRGAAAVVAAHHTGGGTSVGAAGERLVVTGAYWQGGAERIPRGEAGDIPRGGRARDALDPGQFGLPSTSPPHEAFSGWAFLRIPRAVALHCCRVSHWYLPAVLPLMSRRAAAWLLHATALPGPTAHLAAGWGKAPPRPWALTVPPSAAPAEAAAPASPAPTLRPFPPSAAALLAFPATPLQLCARALTPLAYGRPTRPAAPARFPAVAPTAPARFPVFAPAGQPSAGSRVFFSAGRVFFLDGRVLSLGPGGAHSHARPAAEEDVFFLPGGRGAPSPDLLLASHSSDTLAVTFLPAHAADRRRRVELLCELMLEWAGKEEGEGDGWGSGAGTGAAVGVAAGAWEGAGQGAGGGLHLGGGVSRFDRSKGAACAGGWHAQPPAGLPPPWAVSQAEMARALQRFLGLLAQARPGLELEPGIAAALVRRSGLLRTQLGAYGK
jgi:hypothetical protein